MRRLCGRPGCSDGASVAYGMRAADLVFWLDALPSDPGDDVAVLCRRHADSMVVPRGWTLDDLRDPDLHLFRPPQPLPPPAPRARIARPALDPDATGEQLRLRTDVELIDDDDLGDAFADTPVAVADPGPWTPAFDEADDLGGLLSARSPLLSRAFRIAERSDS